MTNEPPAVTVAGSPPPPPLPPTGKASSLRSLIVILLSLCLGLFLIDAAMSLMDDTLIVLFDAHILSAFRGMTAFFAFVMAVLIYGLMALTPMIPKRLFLPVVLFTPAAFLAGIPCLIYCSSHMKQVAWVISFCELLCALGILYLVQGSFKFRWPLVPEKRLKPRGFSWGNLLAFVLVNLFVLLPAVIFYFVFCAALGVDHFSDGFVKLRPGGLAVSVRKYVRDDGKTVQLFPMSHVADAGFYREISESFPTNSIILLEGVSDSHNLLTNKISYKQMAKTLGLSEQQKEFKPSRGTPIRADIDVDQFSQDTISLLNFVMLIHARGLTPENLVKLLEYPAPPNFDEELFDDLLRKRNRHLLEEMHTHLAETDYIVVPWGAAHMPGLAREIQKTGFHLVESREYMNIRFCFPGNRPPPVADSDPKK
jgi:hypothetical protein